MQYEKQALLELKKLALDLNQNKQSLCTKYQDAQKGWQCFREENEKPEFHMFHFTEVLSLSW